MSRDQLDNLGVRHKRECSGGSNIGVDRFLGDALTRFSYLLAGLLPDARLKIYPDAAHGFLFQHHGEFAADMHAFLSQVA